MSRNEPTDNTRSSDKTLRSKSTVKRGNSLWRPVFFSAAFIYMELLFHIAIYHGIDSNIMHPLTFAIACGLTLSALTSFWHRIANAITAYTIWGIFTVYYIAQFVYYKIFRTFLSLVSIGGAHDAMNFKSVLFATLRANWYVILLFLLPLICLVLLNRLKFTFDRGRIGESNGVLKGVIVQTASSAVMWIAAICLLAVHGTGAYTPYSLFHGRYVLELSMNKLGVVMTTGRDCTVMITKSNSDKTFELAESALDIQGRSNSMSSLSSDKENQNSKSSGNESSNSASGSNSTESSEPQYVPQIDENINLTRLYNSTDDDELKSITAYFSGVQPTYTDEYTGMFKDYNVVFVTAESLSTYGISKEATPTLYKIYHEGFEFTNFYNPLWYHSTIDGEFANCLSQYPASSKWSFEESADTYQPYALGNILNSQGYKSYGYHDFDATYYDRTSTHPNMGYTTFKAIGAGLDIPDHVMYSDLECIEAVYNDFIDDDHFNMYLMSFSGHLPYNYDNQYICQKNREEAESLLSGKGYSDEAVAYVAAQMELDKALEYLMDKLEEAGKLDNTLFIVAPDHYPYGLSDGVYNELAGKDIEDDDFELHRNQFGIWSSSMKKPVVTDKLCASIDILPTVLNLLGADFDSRLLAGRNILSDSDELVIFADQSFITDKIKYDAATGETTYLVPESQVPDGYLNSMIAEVENRLYISDEVIDTDYFSFVYGKSSDR
ncbi:LTA synthase family protein [Coprococcus eutactus]|mgnify:CR=1 FL=1|uniref:LTA synthase family protein n=1 Tax=Coprococcus eutactus TaxID=33043 RepID=A0A3R5WKJ8_9FIRM|nr:LTA synthase family protein [Coprococcus eutactus]